MSYARTVLASLRPNPQRQGRLLAFRLFPSPSPPPSSHHSFLLTHLFPSWHPPLPQGPPSVFPSSSRLLPRPLLDALPILPILCSLLYAAALHHMSVLASHKASAMMQLKTQTRLARVILHGIHSYSLMTALPTVSDFTRLATSVLCTTWHPAAISRRNAC